MVKFIVIRDTHSQYVVEDTTYYNSEYGMITKKFVTLDENGDPDGILTVFPTDVVEMHEPYSVEEIERLENVMNMAQEMAEDAMRKKVEEMKAQKRSSENEHNQDVV